MKYPKWAPGDVVELYKEYLDERDSFSLDDFTKDELDRKAQSLGFAHWVDFEEAATQKVEAIERLVTRPEMETFWAWLGNLEISHTARGGIIGTLTSAIDRWYKTNKKSVSDRSDEFQQIAKHAKALSRLLVKYRGEHHQAFNQFTGLISHEYNDRLEQFLHPDLLQRLEAMSYRVNPVWNAILPPLDEILSNLAVAALNSNAKPLGNYPRKITARNAFRTYLINNFVAWFYSMKSNPSPTLMATFLSVALDDASITIDTVVHSEANKEIKLFIEDFGK
jgi:hypothetical protein